MLDPLPFFSRDLPRFGVTVLGELRLDLGTSGPLRVYRSVARGSAATTAMTSIPERPGDDFVDILGQPPLLRDALQLAAHQVLAHRIVTSPLVEQGRHARSELGVQGIEIDDQTSQVAIGLASAIVKADVVGRAEDPGEGAQSVGDCAD